MAEDEKVDCCSGTLVIDANIRLMRSVSIKLLKSFCNILENTGEYVSILNLWALIWRQHKKYQKQKFSNTKFTEKNTLSNKWQKAIEVKYVDFTNKLAMKYW